MKQQQIEDLIEETSMEDLCGRRPWHNVEDFRRLYKQGTPHGASGLPYGPDTSAIYRVVQLNFTPEIEVFYMLFEICLSIFSMNSLKEHIQG